MKRRPILNFFDISSNLEELPENELFVLKGGNSDDEIKWEVEGEEALVEREVEGDPEPETEEPWEAEEPWETEEPGWDGDGGGGESPIPPLPEEEEETELLECFSRNLKFDADLGAEFKDRLNESLKTLVSTPIGKKLIAALSRGNVSLSITNDGMHSFNTANNHLNLGVLNEPSSNFTNNYQNLALAHELFHAFQDSRSPIVGQQISDEVEARLFEYEYVKSLNDDEAITNFKDLYFKGGAEDYFNKFTSFADSTNKNVNDFNNLIDGFKENTTGGSVYDSYAVNHLTSLNNFSLTYLQETSGEDFPCNGK